MKYTKNDLYEGMKLRCVSTTEPHWWNVGKQYEVEKRTVVLGLGALLTIMIAIGIYLFEKHYLN